ncbi:MAG TPA: ribonuclease P protein component [Cyclobacteriaceae bacterium]|nr:ribonuclease P protein component [Cyclobacteriaceae bacterium]HPW63238.1 ribonuclease P protein component [Cyclobacteriaceae bacterium]
MGRFTFTKAERLSKEKLIQELFEKGSSFYLYPFKVVHRLSPDQGVEAVNQVLISVSTRQFKRAVDRNKVKRRVREAYRLQKEIIQSRSEKGIFSFIYTAKEILPFAEIKGKLFLVLEKIKKLESL